MEKSSLPILNKTMCCRNPMREVTLAEPVAYNRDLTGECVKTRYQQITSTMESYLNNRQQKLMLEDSLCDEYTMKNVFLMEREEALTSSSSESVEFESTRS